MEKAVAAAVSEGGMYTHVSSPKFGKKRRWIVHKIVNDDLYRFDDLNLFSPWLTENSIFFIQSFFFGLRVDDDSK